MTTIKQSKRSSRRAAYIRRALAERWTNKSHSFRYQKAAAKEASIRTTAEIMNEVFDGILLDLRNNRRSDSCQKRILRRIVEKRQAQATHRRICRGGNRYAKHLVDHSIKECMRDIKAYRTCTYF